MNHLRKKAAVQKHFSEPYQSLEEMQAGLKADEAAYTEEEIGEIVEGIKEKAKAASEAEGKVADTKETVTNLFPEAQQPSAEELAEFKAWKAKQNGLQAETTTELAKAVADTVPISRYKDFDEFRGTVVKTSVPNPHNPERPHVIILHIDLGKIVRMTRIEPALAHEFNELAIGHSAIENHGEASTALFYFPKGQRQNGDQVSITEFAAFQRQDMRFRPNYDPRKNISLIMAAQEAASNY